VRPDPWDLLEKITAPTVLIAGTEEDPDRTQNETAARVPDARSVHLTGVGHVGAFLRPDDVVAAALPALRGAGVEPAGRIANHQDRARIRRRSRRRIRVNRAALGRGRLRPAGVIGSRPAPPRRQSMGISAEARGAFLNRPRRPFTGRHLISLSQRVPGYP
jgi:hypothetical protein